MTTTDRRADPYVGVSLGALRFLLLAMVTVAASAYAWQYVHQVITMDSAQSRLLWCSTTSPTDPSPPYRTEQARCWAETMAHPLAVTITVGVLITAAAILVSWVLAPRLRVVVARLRPAPPALDRLSQLAVATWWSLVLTAALPYGVAALASGYALATAVPLLKFVMIIVLTRLLCLAVLRARARAISQPADVSQDSGLDLVTLAATGAFVVPAFSLWLQQLSYGMSVSAVAAHAAAWLGGAGLGAGVWALSWRQAAFYRVTGRPGSAVLSGAVALTVGFSLGVLLTPLPREGGGLVDQHTAAQWISLAVVALVGAALTLRLSRALAERLVARVRTHGTRHLLDGAGVVTTALAAALVLDAVRTFAFLAHPGMPVTEVGWLTAVRFMIMPATWVVAVAAAAAGILALRQPPVSYPEMGEWTLRLRDAELAAGEPLDSEPTASELVRGPDPGA